LCSKKKELCICTREKIKIPYSNSSEMMTQHFFFNFFLLLPSHLSFSPFFSYAESNGTPKVTGECKAATTLFIQIQYVYINSIGVHSDIHITFILHGQCGSSAHFCVKKICKFKFFNAYVDFFK
jgi:hypothetical protein